NKVGADFASSRRHRSRPEGHIRAGAWSRVVGGEQSGRLTRCVGFVAAPAHRLGRTIAHGRFSRGEETLGGDCKIPVFRRKSHWDAADRPHRIVWSRSQRLTRPTPVEAGRDAECHAESDSVVGGIDGTVSLKNSTGETREPQHQTYI